MPDNTLCVEIRSGIELVLARASISYIEATDPEHVEETSAPEMGAVQASNRTTNARGLVWWSPSGISRTLVKSPWKRLSINSPFGKLTMSPNYAVSQQNKSLGIDGGRRGPTGCRSVDIWELLFGRIGFNLSEASSRLWLVAKATNGV